MNVKVMSYYSWRSGFFETQCIHICTPLESAMKLNRRHQRSLGGQKVLIDYLKRLVSFHTEFAGVNGGGKSDIKQ